MGVTYDENYRYYNNVNIQIQFNVGIIVKEDNCKCVADYKYVNVVNAHGRSPFDIFIKINILGYKEFREYDVNGVLEMTVEIKLTWHLQSKNRFHKIRILHN